MYEYFYNKNLRKLVVAFGSLFNNITVEHENPDGGSALQIRVPISYAPQEKFVQRLLQPSSIDDTTRIEKQLPVMSYIINTVTPDPSRRRNKFNYTIAHDVVNDECQASGNQVLQEVPVNVAFTLYIYTRHIDDTLQIIEQIIPYFNPEHIVTLTMNEVNQNVNIPIIMGQNSISERFDGDLQSRRLNVSSMGFVAKSYIFGQVKPLISIENAYTISGITYDPGT